MLVVVPSHDDGLDGLLAIAEQLARLDRGEPILVRLLDDPNELESATSTLNRRRALLSVPARTAAFTTSEPARDIVRFAASHDVGLILLDAPADLQATPLPAGLAAILDRSPTDVAVLAHSATVPPGRGVKRRHL